MSKSDLQRLYESTEEFIKLAGPRMTDADVEGEVKAALARKQNPLPAWHVNAKGVAEMAYVDHELWSAYLKERRANDDIPM